MDVKDVLDNRVLIFDGAMGTMLGKYDSERYSMPEMLNVINPKLVTSVHKRYVQAGADVITTFTLGVNAIRLKGTAYTVSTLIAAACQNAKAAESSFLALGIGPIGYGLSSVEYKREEIASVYNEIVSEGIKQGVDGILFESFYDVQEARIAVLEAIKLCNLPIFLSFSIHEKGKTITGDSIDQCVSAFEDLALTALGFNCSVTPTEIEENLNKLKAISPFPMMIQPNAGPSKIVLGRRVYANNVETFTEGLKRCIDQGVSIIGGCCGTSPQYIQGISKFKKHYQKSKPYASKGSMSNANRVVRFKRPLLVSGDQDMFLKGNADRYCGNQAFINLLERAYSHVKRGADVLYLSIPVDIDDEFLKTIIKHLGHSLVVPLIVKVADTAILEQVIQQYSGRLMIHMDYTYSEMDKEILFKLAKEYGALIICPLFYNRSDVCKEEILLLIDEWIDYGKSFGLSENQLFMDISLRHMGNDFEGIEPTLTEVNHIKGKRQVRMFMELDPIGDGHLQKKSIHTAVFALALSKGIDLILVNSESVKYADMIKGLCIIKGQALEEVPQTTRTKTTALLLNQIRPKGVNESIHTFRRCETIGDDRLSSRQQIVFVFTDESWSIIGPALAMNILGKEKLVVYDQQSLYQGIEKKCLDRFFHSQPELFFIRVSIGALEEILAGIRSLHSSFCYGILTDRKSELFQTSLDLEYMSAIDDLFK